MVKHFLLFILLTISSMLFAQNLVPNPSFEEYKEIPCDLMLGFTGYRNINWFSYGWFTPTSGTSDLFTNLNESYCYANTYSTNEFSNGQQSPRTGDFMAGIFTYGLGCLESMDYREYISIRLKSPITEKKIYYCEFFVSNADYENMASNNIGLHFSQDSIADINECLNLNLPPQIIEKKVISDSDNWTRISGLFKAIDSMFYINIGNFSNDVNTTVQILQKLQDVDHAYYFIDDISVIEAPICTIQSYDTFLCSPNQIILNAEIENGIYLWNDGSTSPTLEVGSSGKYWVAKTVDGCLDIDTFNVQKIFNPVLNLGNNQTLCENETAILTANYDGYTNYWFDGSNEMSITISQPGTYWLDINNGYCTYTDTVNVFYNPLPIFQLPGDTALCENEALEVSPSIYYQEANYLWSDGSTESILIIKNSGLFALTIELKNCLFEDSILVLPRVCDVQLEMPNVFTPNYDQLNDNFEPIFTKGIINYTLKVFNRWGKQVYHLENENIRWDGYSNSGTELPSGTYYYSIEYLDLNNELNEVNGYVTLLR